MHISERVETFYTYYTLYLKSVYHYLTKLYLVVFYSYCIWESSLVRSKENLFRIKWDNSKLRFQEKGAVRRVVYRMKPI